MSFSRVSVKQMTSKRLGHKFRYSSSFCNVFVEANCILVKSMTNAIVAHLQLLHAVVSRLFTICGLGTARTSVWITSYVMARSVMKASRNGPEHRSGIRFSAGNAFR